MRRRVRIPVVAGFLLAVAIPWAGAQDTRSAKPENFSGYAEWTRGRTLIVDGQRVVANPATKFKSKGFPTLESIPLGHEVGVKGIRLPDGALLATEVEAKPNGVGMFENDIRSATDEMEAKWLQDGAITEEDDGGKERTIGRVVTAGPRVERVQRITRRILPPYVDASRIRVHVVETKGWNAMAMGNGAVWVFTGLLDDMSDDEVALILGHELAHYTHEHSRREFKRAFWGQLIGVGAMLAAEALTDDEKKQAGVAVAAMAVMLVKRNGYSRELEDQADRVGMRYAYEGGYDVSKGPSLWTRFRDKYGDENGLMNFFLGSHPQASDRIKRLTREVELNYRVDAAR